MNPSKTEPRPPSPSPAPRTQDTSNSIGASATPNDISERTVEKPPGADSRSKDRSDELGAAVPGPSCSVKDLLCAIIAKADNPIMQSPVGQFLRTELVNCYRTNTTPPAWFTRLALALFASGSSSSSKQTEEKLDRSREGISLAPSRQNEESVGSGAERTGDRTPTPIRRPSGSTESIRTAQPRKRSSGGTTTAASVAFPGSLSSVRNTAAAQVGRLTTTPDRPIGHVKHTPSFVIEQSDLPSSLRLTGAPSEDIPGIMQQFRSWVHMYSAEATLNDEVDRCAVAYLPLLVREAAADSMQQLLTGTLEWRSEKELAEQNPDGAGSDLRAPVLWREWVSAFTQLFSPDNLVALLARSLVSLEQEDSQSVSSFSLRVNKAYSRLLAEVERTSPADGSPHSHALEALMTAYFEKGLLPHIGRMESTREETSCSFQASLARAKKHEADNLLRGPSTQAPGAHASVVTGFSPQERQLATAVANFRQNVSQPTARGRKETSRSDARPPSRPRASDKRRRSRSRDALKRRKRKNTTAGSPCDYPACRNQYSHSRADCRVAKSHADQGWTAVSITDS